MNWKGRERRWSRVLILDQRIRVFLAWVDWEKHEKSVFVHFLTSVLKEIPNPIPPK